MKADGIFRVTEALRERLKAALASSSVPGTVFVGPLDDADSSGAALILFLYRIVPNPSLRNRERRVESGNPTKPDFFQNSIPLDLYFLVTVGTTPNDSEETPLRALGSVIQHLQKDPALIGPDLSYETVRVTLEPLTTEEASRIWALFPVANYRTSVAYLASPVWIDPSSPESTAERVRGDELRTGPKVAEVMP